MKQALIVLFLFFLVPLKGQVTSLPDSGKVEKTYKNTLSVNASVFLEKLFKSNLTPDLNNAFLYYSRDCSKFFVRAGVNGWNSKKTEENVKSKELTIRNNFYSSAMLGFYFRKELNRSFSAAYGLNLIGAYEDSTVTFVTAVDNVENYAKTYHYGFAPGVLLKYKLNKRVSFFAEYTMPIKLAITETGTKYSLFPEENTTDRRSTGISLLFYNPLNIYVSCSF